MPLLLSSVSKGLMLSSPVLIAVLLMMAMNLPATFLAHFLSPFAVRRELRGGDGVDVLCDGVEPVPCAVDRCLCLPVAPSVWVLWPSPQWAVYQL